MFKEYVILATGCVSVGVVLTFFLIGITQRLGINIVEDHLWMVGIPAVLSLILNVTLLELYRKFFKKDKRPKID